MSEVLLGQEPVREAVRPPLIELAGVEKVYRTGIRGDYESPRRWQARPRIGWPLHQLAFASNDEPDEPSLRPTTVPSDSKR